MRKVKAPLVSHVDGSKMETGFMGLKKTNNDVDVTPCAFLRVNNLKTYVEEIIFRDSWFFRQ